MGCDIHFFVEKRGAFGLWERAEEMIPNRYATEDWCYHCEQSIVVGGALFIHKETRQAECDPKYWPDNIATPQPALQRAEWYDGRNYSLFAILANVRNGYGFAGCDLGDGFVPIAMPRGIPDDASEEYRRTADRYGIDGHSHSWVTVAEILSYDWDQRTKRRCMVNDFGKHSPLDAPENQWKDGGYADWVQEYANEYGQLPPRTESCGGISGQGAAEWKTIEYTSPYWQAVGDTEWIGCLLRMTRIATGDLSSVRAVFFFDN